MISVFRTSVLTGKDIDQLRPHLDKLPQNKWNFDLEDCDKILRIDSEREISQAIIRLLQEKGYNCEELTD